MWPLITKSAGYYLFVEKTTTKAFQNINAKIKNIEFY